MVLIIAGCGVYGGSFTRELLEALDEADIIYVDLYTMPGFNWVSKALERWSGKVKVADRNLLESQSKTIVDEAVGKRVVIVSAGDPLIATTHQSLLAEAVSMGVPVRYIPGVSGVCAAKAYSGLSYYRFGRTATIPGPWRGLKPYSVVAVVYGNLCIDAHTLLLLDVSDEGMQLDPRSAALELLEAEEGASKAIGLEGVLENTPVILVERAGAPEVRLRVYDSLRGLAESGEDLGVPSSLVVPASLSSIELWILESRLRVKMSSTWSRRVYERSTCCKYYENLMSWLSGG